GRVAVVGGGADADGDAEVPGHPPQGTFWRFLASLHLSVAGHIQRVQRTMRQRVWQAAHVDLKTIILDTDTTVHTLFGHQMGGRKSYNPKNKGKKSYQPILTFLAETREYVAGGLPNGGRANRQQNPPHLAGGFAPRSEKRGDGLCARRFRILLLRSGGGL